MAPNTTATRRGKIARLPRDIRERLNLRLRNGEQGKKLVEWLNTLPEVMDVMETEFENRPINEGNLSEWKQGGYQDWLHHQEVRDDMRELSGELTELREDAGLLPLSDQLGVSMAMLLAQALRQLKEGGLDKPARRREAMELVDTLCHLRRSDHRAEHLRVELEKEEAAAVAAKKKAIMAAMDPITKQKEAMTDFMAVLAVERGFKHLLKLVNPNMSLEAENVFRELCHMEPRVKAASAAAVFETTTSNTCDPSQSDLIRVNPTKKSAGLPGAGGGTSGGERMAEMAGTCEQGGDKPVQSNSDPPAHSRACADVSPEIAPAV